MADSKTPVAPRPMKDDEPTPDFTGLFEGLTPEPESQDDRDLIPPRIGISPYLKPLPGISGTLPESGRTFKYLNR